MKPKKNKDEAAAKKSKEKAKAKDVKISKETVESLSDDELGDVAGGFKLDSPTVACLHFPVATGKCLQTVRALTCGCPTMQGCDGTIPPTLKIGGC